MAGYMYLGNKKVCPAILVGSQPEPPEYDSLIKMPNGLKELDVDENYISIFSGNWSSITPVPAEANIKVLLDLNELEIVTGGSSSFWGGAPFQEFFDDGMYWTSIDIKAENLKEAGVRTFNYFATKGYDVQRDTNVFYNPIIRFPKLEKIGSYCFLYFVNSGITDIYLPKLKTSHSNGLSDMCTFADRQITLHFASNQESLISSLNGYPNFGSSYPVTILYDQPPTE